METLQQSESIENRGEQFKDEEMDAFMQALEEAERDAESKKEVPKKTANKMQRAQLAAVMFTAMTAVGCASHGSETKPNLIEQLGKHMHNASEDYREKRDHQIEHMKQHGGKQHGGGIKIKAGAKL